MDGSIQDIFDSPNYPDDVRALILDSSVRLRTMHNYIPRNSVVLFLDFAKPGIFNFTLQPSHETPNGSNIAVKGHDVTWVNGLFHEFSTISEVTSHHFLGFTSTPFMIFLSG